LEEERVASQKTRLQLAVATARSNAEVANLLVQRSKDAEVSPAELGNVGRILRGHLSLLAKQLENEDELLSNWSFGSLLSSKS